MDDKLKTASIRQLTTYTLRTPDGEEQWSPDDKEVLFEQEDDEMPDVEKIIADIKKDRPEVVPIPIVGVNTGKLTIYSKFKN